jgi:hypothetical protein
MNLPPITNNRARILNRAQTKPQASTVLSSTARLSGARARNRFLESCSCSVRALARTVLVIVIDQLSIITNFLPAEGWAEPPTFRNSNRNRFLESCSCSVRALARTVLVIVIDQLSINTNFLPAEGWAEPPAFRNRDRNRYRLSSFDYDYDYRFAEHEHEKKLREIWISALPS